MNKYFLQNIRAVIRAEDGEDLSKTSLNGNLDIEKLKKKTKRSKT
jgi:hypothetical protein